MSDFGKYAAFNDGLAVRAVSADYVAADGEVLFDHLPTEAELETAFPGYEAAAKTAALAQTVFTKLQIRRAMRSLGIESQLDSLLASSTEFASDWSDAQDIDTADTLTALALASASIDVEAIKLKIAGL